MTPGVCPAAACCAEDRTMKTKKIPRAARHAMVRNFVIEERPDTVLYPHHRVKRSLSNECRPKKSEEKSPATVSVVSIGVNVAWEERAKVGLFEIPGRSGTDLTVNFLAPGKLW